MQPRHGASSGGSSDEISLLCRGDNVGWLQARSSAGAKGPTFYLHPIQLGTLKGLAPEYNNRH